MAVSSNSIVHYTKTLNNLKSILYEQSFRVKYCHENICINFENGTHGCFDIAIPMVCFCDIPFTDVETLTKEYGYYGIGLSKEWAIRNKLNPVLYMEKNSNIAKTLNRIYSNIADLAGTNLRRRDIHSSGNSNELIKCLFSLLGYIKNYSNDLILDKKKKEIDNYIFYNEREWRFVPEKKGLDELILNDEYQKNKDKFNGIAATARLEFSYDDISYIVLKNKKQLSSFKQFLGKIVDSDTSSFFGKIITIEQLRSDF